MKIFLTGNLGFIGTKLEKKLKEDFEVKGFDIKNSEIIKIDGLSFLRKQDVRDKDVLEQSIEKFKPDIIIHLAALAGVRDSLKYPKDYIDTNITGVYNLLEVAKKYKAKLLFASSSSVYGGLKCPLKEDMDCGYQLSPYAMTKFAGECICKMFEDVPTIIFRPFTVYGGEIKDMRKDMVIHKLIEAGRSKKTFYKYGDGSSTRGYTNVYDLIEGIIKLIDYRPKDNFCVFNLGGNEVIKLNDLIDLIKEKYPDLKVEEIERKSVDPIESYADISKAERILNWQIKRDFKESIRKTLEKEGDKL